jgi:hypothetical protein
MHMGEAGATRRAGEPPARPYERSEGDRGGVRYPFLNCLSAAMAPRRMNCASLPMAQI